MALATKCPHCNTIFRVAADQLKLRGGIVRCGACKEVFDGNATLLDPAAIQAPEIRPAPAIQHQPHSQPEPEAEFSEETSLDFDLDFDLAPPAVAAEQAQPEPPVPVVELQVWRGRAPSAPLQPETEAPYQQPDDQQEERREPSLGPIQEDIDEYIVAAALPDAGEAFTEEAAFFDEPATSEAVAAQGVAPEPFFDEADAVSAAPDQIITSEAEAGQRTAAVAPETVEQEEEPEATPATEEPGFVRQGRRRQRTGKMLRIMMSAGSLLLFAGLLAQGMANFRNQLALQLPQLKPALQAVCAAAGCRIELPSQIDALSVEQGELQILAERTLSYATVLHNQSGSAQGWPSIELTLNDTGDKPLLRRVFAPRDYLPLTVEIGQGFPARSEQAVKLYFELNQLKASGYHIAVFYP